MPLPNPGSRGRSSKLVKSVSVLDLFTSTPFPSVLEGLNQIIALRHTSTQKRSSGKPQALQARPGPRQQDAAAESRRRHCQQRL